MPSYTFYPAVAPLPISLNVWIRSLFVWLRVSFILYFLCFAPISTHIRWIIYFKFLLRAKKSNKNHTYGFIDWKKIKLMKNYIENNNEVAETTYAKKIDGYIYNWSFIGVVIVCMRGIALIHISRLMWHDFFFVFNRFLIYIY